MEMILNPTSEGTFEGPWETQWKDCVSDKILANVSFFALNSPVPMVNTIPWAPVMSHLG